MRWPRPGNSVRTAAVGPGRGARAGRLGARQRGLDERQRERLLEPARDHLGEAAAREARLQDQRADERRARARVGRDLGRDPQPGHAEAAVLLRLAAVGALDAQREHGARLESAPASCARRRRSRDRRARSSRRAGAARACARASRRPRRRASSAARDRRATGGTARRARPCDERAQRRVGGRRGRGIERVGAALVGLGLRAAPELDQHARERAMQRGVVRSRREAVAAAPARPSRGRPGCAGSGRWRGCGARRSRARRRSGPPARRAERAQPPASAASATASRTSGGRGRIAAS